MLRGQQCAPYPFPSAWRGSRRGIRPRRSPQSQPPQPGAGPGFPGEPRVPPGCSARGGAPGPRRPAHLPCPRPARPPEAPHVAVLVGEVAARLTAAVLEVGEAAAVDERGALAAPRAREGLHEAAVEAVVARAHPAALAHGGGAERPASACPSCGLLSALLSARPLCPSCGRASGPAICRSVPCSVPTLRYLPPLPAQPSAALPTGSQEDFRMGPVECGACPLSGQRCAAGSGG